MQMSEVPWKEVFALAEKLVSNQRPHLGERLGEYYSQEEAELWLTRPQPMLGGQTAIQLIAAGRDDELHRVLDGLDGQIAT